MQNTTKSGRAGTLRANIVPLPNTLRGRRMNPLVHYMQSDFEFHRCRSQNGSSGVQTGVHKMAIHFPQKNLPLLPDLGLVNARYQPWANTTDRRNGIRRQLPIRINMILLLEIRWLGIRSLGFSNQQIPDCGLAGPGASWHAVANVFLKAETFCTKQQGGHIHLYIGTNTWAVWTGIPPTPLTPPTARRCWTAFCWTCHHGHNDNASRRSVVGQRGGELEAEPGWRRGRHLFSGMVA